MNSNPITGRSHYAPLTHEALPQMVTTNLYSTAPNFMSPFSSPKASNYARNPFSPKGQSYSGMSMTNMGNDPFMQSNSYPIHPFHSEFESDHMNVDPTVLNFFASPIRNQPTLVPDNNANSHSSHHNTSTANPQIAPVTPQGSFGGFESPQKFLRTSFSPGDLLNSSPNIPVAPLPNSPTDRMEKLHAAPQKPFKPTGGLDRGNPNTAIRQPQPEDREATAYVYLSF